MPAIPPLSQVRIVVILLSVLITLLFLRNNLISLHQSLNFVLFPLNHPGSGIILFSIPACLFYTVLDADDTDILSMYSVVSSKMSSLVIFNDLNLSDNTLILFSQCWSILLSVDYITSVVCSSYWFRTIIVPVSNHYTLFFCKVSLVMLY